MTTPTNNAVPSNAPNDLLFNAEKLDEVVSGTSQYYTDRKGVTRRTLAGIEASADSVLGGLGYLPPAAYASGISMTLSTQTVEYSGEVYATKVSALPFTTSTWATDSAKFRLIQGITSVELAASGGAGLVGYMPAGTGAVATTVQSKLREFDDYSATFIGNEDGVIHINSVTSNLSSDNRSAIFAATGRVFVPTGITVRCNLLPDDDVRKFAGGGKVTTTDLWGHTHTLDIAALNSGPKLTVHQMLSRGSVALGSLPASIKIGAIGDSITDGAFGGAFSSPNPVDANGNLSSTNYTHGATEATGSKAWFTLCINNLIGLSGHNADHPRAVFVPYNAARSGKGIADGWAYRNFDYGFFQNTSYGNTAPDVLFVSMGTNDIETARSPALQDDYIDKCEALISKAAGYGCKAVCFIAITHWRSLAAAFYEATFKHITACHPTVCFINAANHLENYSNSGVGLFSDAWKKVSGIGGGFDPVHPSVNGHKILAGAIACELMPDRITTVSHGDRFVSAQSGRTQAWTAQYDEIVPFGVAVSEAWLLPETGWPVYQASSGTTGLDMTLRHYVWCDEPMDVTIIEPKAAYWPAGASKNTYASIMRHGYDESAVEVSALASSGRSLPSYCSTVVKSLAMGLNIVDIKYDNVINMYAPVLQFSRVGYVSESIGPMAIKLTASTAKLYRHTTELDGVNHRSHRLPSLGADWVSTISCERIINGTALLGWFDVYSGTAYSVLKNSNTQVQVCSVTSGTVMTPIQTITGDFSGSFVVQFAKTGSSGLVQVTDTALAATAVSIPGVHDGSIGIANTTGSPARIKIADVRIEIPRTNGSIII